MVMNRYSTFPKLSVMEFYDQLRSISKTLFVREGSYLSGVVQSAYSTTPADRTEDRHGDR